MFKEAGAGLLVSKDSGVQGGTDQKFSAAARLGMQVILIRRPDLDYPNRFSDIPSIKRYLINQNYQDLPQA